MTPDPHALGTLTLRSLDGTTAELDARVVPAGAIVILQTLDPIPAEVLVLAREQLRNLLGEEVAARFLVVDHRWRVWPVPVPESPEAS